MKKLICLGFLFLFVSASPILAQEAKPEQQLLVLQKLDQIMKTQQEIIKQLAAMKEELYIVKIRATR